MTTRRSAVLVIAALLLAAACSNADTTSGSGTTSTPSGPGTTYAGTNYDEHVPVDAPGVTDTEIRVGSITATTNPLGTDLGLLNDGIEAYFDTINAQGGIYGRKLKLVSKRDDQTVRNATEAQALLAQDKVYAAFIGSVLFTGAKLLAQAGIPTFGWNINAEWAGPKNFFPNVAPLCFEGCPLFPHQFPWVAQQVGAHRVALLGYDVPQSAACVNGTKNAFQRFGDNVGAKLVYSDASLTFGQVDLSPQVAKMKDEHVDFLVTCTDFNGDYAIAQEMQRQGIRDDVTFLHPNMYNHDFVAKNGDAFEGDIVLDYLLAVEHKPLPQAVQEYLDYAAAHDLKVTEMTMHGWVAAHQFVDALKATGPNFTWTNLINAWNQENFYTAGGWSQPIDWTKNHQPPSDWECLTYVKIEHSKFVPWGGAPNKPWVCFDGTKPNEWQEPHFVSFDTSKPFTFADTTR